MGLKPNRSNRSAWRRPVETNNHSNRCNWAGLNKLGLTNDTFRLVTPPWTVQESWKSQYQVQPNEPVRTRQCRFDRIPIAFSLIGPDSSRAFGPSTHHNLCNLSYQSGLDNTGWAKYACQSVNPVRTRQDRLDPKPIPTRPNAPHGQDPVDEIPIPTASTGPDWTRTV